MILLTKKEIRDVTKEDILRLRDTAEQMQVQFKERVTHVNKSDVSCEMVALSNSRGGMIVGITGQMKRRLKQSLPIILLLAWQVVVVVRTF